MVLKNPDKYQKNKTIVYFIRHGDRIHIPGAPMPRDFGLSKKGIKQAKEVETGTKIKRDRTMIENKVKELNKNYDEWFFVIIDNNNLKDYKKVAKFLQVL